jgi:hypothetical protein
MPNLCYLCGAAATLPLQLKDSFTAHSSCKVPSSTMMCSRCNLAINGEEKQLWYWNSNKDKWSKLWGRSLSRLYKGDQLLSPVIEGTHTEGGTTLPIVRDLATRAQIRDWLVNPPEPPFTIAIAESGQKHILPWAQTAHAQNHFPVQFELDCLWIKHSQFVQLLEIYEGLMGGSFSKTEIDSGQYHSDRLCKAIKADRFYPLEEAIAPHRGTRLLQLVSHVAQISFS